MNKKFVISSLVMAVGALMLGFVVHAQLLQADYLRLGTIFRPESEAQGYFGFMLLAHLLIGIGLTWIYRTGHDAGKGVIVQGLRFGAAIAVVSTIPMYLIYYAVQRLPSDLVAQQIVFDTICMLLLGVLVAWLNKTP
jgi:drug/metabolite transporter (DMT)-like permease